MATRLNGKVLVPGTAEGAALVSREPLSLWGGLDPQTGQIIDRRHDRCGAVVTGRVFAFPTGRGSSTASAVLLESIRAGTAPAAALNRRMDAILALGAIVADELYGRSLPVVLLPAAAFETLRDGDWVRVDADGTVIVGAEEEG